MSREGFIPAPLRADELKKLVLEALEKAPEDHNPETFHALFDHLERGLSTDDVIHALEGHCQTCLQQNRMATQIRNRWGIH